MATVFSVFRVVFAVTVGWYLLLAAGLVFSVLGDAGTFSGYTPRSWERWRFCPGRY